MKKPLMMGLTLIMGITLSACASKQTETSMDLADSRWYMSGDFYQIADIKLPAFNLEQNEQGFKINGTTGCNNFFGQATWDGQQLTIEQPLALTRKMCTGMANTIEAEFVEAIAQPLTLDGEQLRLSNGAELKRVPSNN